MNVKTVGISLAVFVLTWWLIGLGGILVGAVMLGVGYTAGSIKPNRALQSGQTYNAITQRFN